LSRDGRRGDRGGAPSEGEAERSPDAAAARAMLEERLARCSPAEAAAFWKAVRRCYAGAVEPEKGRA